MTHSVRRWLLSAGAVAVVGASACLQAGPASAARVSAASHNSPNARAAATTYVPPAENLYFGDHGAAVKSVQKRLNQLGYYAGPADGQYGNDLEEAVWAFKEVQGLPMNASSNSIITYKFRKDLVHPKAPYSKYPKGGAGRIEINQSIQVLVLYRNNKPHLILHVSSGGRYYYCNQGSCGYAITPDGKFMALSYLQGNIKVPLGYMENPVFFIGRAYAIHGGDAVPWYPASHGCVRIYDDAVNWFHKLVHIGSTHIYVFGTAPQYLA
jgi:peptidoglycan hydrolase-like protein with peptidoglycan-binding domain